MGTWQPPPRRLSRARSQVVAARAAGSFKNSRCWRSGGIAFANFDPQRSLARSGAHDIRGNDLFDEFRLAQALQSSRGQDDGVVFSLLEFAQARVHVAAQRMNVEIGPDGLQLRLPAQAGRADARALWQILKAGIVARTESVPRVLPFRNGRDFESRRKFGGQVFQRMHGEIDAPGGESFFNFFRKHAFGADLGQGDVGDLVASSVDDFDFHFVAAAAQQRGDVVGLPEGELRAAGADAKSWPSAAASPLRLSFAWTVPRLLSLFLQVEQSPHHIDHSRRLGLFRRRLQRGDRGVHDFIDDAAGQRLDRDFLLRSQWPSRPRTRSISAWRMVSR